MDRKTRILVLSVVFAVLVVLCVWQWLASGPGNPTANYSGTDPAEQAAARVTRAWEQGRHDLAVADVERYLHQPDDFSNIAAKTILALSPLNAADPDARYHKLLHEALGDKRPPVREAAVLALGHCDAAQPGPSTAADTARIAQLLTQDPSPIVRTAAATALGALRAWNTMPQLVAALHDPSADVRGRAGQVIVTMTGLDFGFRADDPPDRRAAVIDRIEKTWPSCKAYYDKHVAPQRGQAAGD